MWWWLLADGVRCSQPVKRRGSAGGSAGDRGAVACRCSPDQGRWKHGARPVTVHATLACNTYSSPSVSRGHLRKHADIPPDDCWLLVSAPALQRKCRIPEGVDMATYPKAPPPISKSDLDVNLVRSETIDPRPFFQGSAQANPGDSTQYPGRWWAHKPAWASRRCQLERMKGCSARCRILPAQPHVCAVDTARNGEFSFDPRLPRRGQFAATVRGLMRELWVLMGSHGFSWVLSIVRRPQSPRSTVPVVRPWGPCT